jgi:hypothetical protein
MFLDDLLQQMRGARFPLGIGFHMHSHNQQVGWKRLCKRQDMQQLQLGTKMCSEFTGLMQSVQRRLAKIGGAKNLANG